MKAVTYGPFPGGWPASFEQDFSRMTEVGFNAVRLFEMPETNLLDAAQRHGLKVFGGLNWGQNADFMMRPGLYSAARVALANSLKDIGSHPALAGVYVGNEVPADLARWMGPVKVRKSLEELIDLGREISPQLLFAYASYPSTEYLEPENADFTAFNVYLEDDAAFRSYLKRLHHIAGDRPLVISEFGLDSRRNGLEKQATVLGWAHQAAHDLETAGLTIYAWSDRWWNNGAEVLDWDFGLNDRKGNAKPALSTLALNSHPLTLNSVSIIVCTRNGRRRISGCLAAIHRSYNSHTTYETIVVDDGSSDGTADFVEKHFPWVQLIRLAPCGLSAARNAGAKMAFGKILAFTDDDCEPDEEWIARILPIFKDARYAAACGPNLPPRARSWEEAVVRAAPGAPSHVMLDDEEAEHLPGCNLVVTKEAFDRIGGFDRRFRTAGDDVDFCWRLRDAGFHLGFVPGAFVWHWRRPSVLAFLRQQLGYGRAEKLLLEKHPHRFSKHGDAKWQGFVYGGGPVRVMDGSIIYHGPMGNAGYQAITNRMLPLRGLEARYDTAKARLALALVDFLQPRLRAWARNRRIFLHRASMETTRPKHSEDFEIDGANGNDRNYFLATLTTAGWQPGGETDAWDAEKNGTRVLLGTEHGELGVKNVLVRVWGDVALLPFKVR